MVLEKEKLYEVRELCKFVTIDDNVILGTDTRLGFYTVIENGSIIGSNCFIGHNCVLRPKTIVGNDCRIGHLCVFEGETTIGNNVHIMPQCHITSYSTIEDNVFIGPMVVTGNDRKLSFMRYDYVPKGVTIKMGARIGLGAILLPGITIGENALIGAGALVNIDVPDGKVFIGHKGILGKSIPKNEYIKRNE